MGTAEQQANGWRVLGGLDLSIYCTEVEIQLASMLWFEGVGLGLDDDITFQSRMVEQQVDKEFVTGDFHTKLAPNKRKPRAE